LTFLPSSGKLVSVKTRYLTPVVEDLCFVDHKMAFVAGPRQCGKTTFAKMLLARRPEGRYWNWDATAFRKRWVRDPSQIVPTAPGGKVPLVVLDEIHKHRRWKRDLKGVYDTLASPCDILVTGSARLNVYRKGSDSLLGRYHHFRLHPLSLREMATAEPATPDDLLGRLFTRAEHHARRPPECLDAMMEFGPFPEPLLAANARKARLWRRERRDLVIREDLRDLSRLPELDRVEMMVALLPARVGSALSLNSLREDLEAGHHTVARWLAFLKELFYVYEIKPYHRSIPRALKKEGKVYFWDFAEVPQEAARFENLVAGHLLKACHLWTDAGHGSFDLSFLRNKEKQEIDFLITRDGLPWLPVEVKLRETAPSPNWLKFLPFLPTRHALQLVRTPHWRLHRIGTTDLLVAGAEEALTYLA
jgi:predicted AAA+ superfamily ATPase